MLKLANLLPLYTTIPKLIGTQSNETKRAKRPKRSRRNNRNERNETKSPKQGKPLLLLRANREQANLGVFQANLSDIQANRSAIYIG